LTGARLLLKTVFGSLLWPLELIGNSVLLEKVPKKVKAALELGNRKRLEKFLHI
jgi:hypothetical protein